MNGKGGLGDHLMKSLDEMIADQRKKGGKPERHQPHFIKKGI